jgi:hypothetical protein
MAADEDAMKHASPLPTACMSGLTTLWLWLLMPTGCQIDSESGKAHEAGDGGQRPGGNDPAGAPHDAGDGAASGDGAFPGDDPSSGGTEPAGGQSGAGGISEEAWTRRADRMRAEIESCLAELVGPSGDDIVSVSGRAGVLGAVEYTIAGYSAGTHDENGLQLATNSVSGERGTPAGIDDTGLWLSTLDGPVVIGRLYESDEDAPARGRLDFRVYADNYMTAATCFGGGSGRFMFTQFDANTVSLDTEAPIATGGYAFECADAEIDVSGCFRYVW